MPGKKKILVDVGLNDMPFPMKVASRSNPDGQPTVGSISIKARIIHEYEANWIDKFIQIIHLHRDKIGTKHLKSNINDYMEKIGASTATIDYAYPYFIEKLTPASNEKCLMRYKCTYSAKMRASESSPKIIFRVEVPAITTDPSSNPDRNGGLFGQLSLVTLEIESRGNVFAEDLVDIVDRHALSPVYSFLTPEDKQHIIEKSHTDSQSSVQMTGEIQNELSKLTDIDWFSVNCRNFSLLHSYSTLVATEKSILVPSSCYDLEEV